MKLMEGERSADERDGRAEQGERLVGEWMLEEVSIVRAQLTSAGPCGFTRPLPGVDCLRFCWSSRRCSTESEGFSLTQAASVTKPQSGHGLSSIS